jgi:amino acid adenylation domain-containing protein
LLLEYNTDLFDASTMQRLLGHLHSLLEGIAADPEQRLWELPLLTTAERIQLTEWNDTTTAYPTDCCLHQLFERQVERTPDAVAVVFEREKLSYRELDRRANRLAHRLQECGVGPEILVGVFMERSLEMVVSLYAVLKAGGAYVPLDPEYPPERIGAMLEDARPRVLLTQQRFRDELPAGDSESICVDSEWPDIAKQPEGSPSVRVKPDNAAYVIFTSGSTGRPKGAVNEHRGICNRLLWMQERYELTGDDCVLQKTPFSFDVSVWEFFWPLMTGARLTVARPGGHKDSAYLIDLITREQVTTVHFVPPMLQVFLLERNVGECRSLKRVICSGEALPFDLTQQFFEKLHAELHNLYGPTEAAIDVTHWQCSADDERTTVPIGRPVANTQIHVLDQRLHQVPIGVPGELHIGGVQVARGYLNRDALTREKFIADPFRDGADARLYKTGDLVRYLADGNIEFLGRMDHQVKIRGHRIELGEIEAVISEHPVVREAVVLAREDRPGDKRLVAYVVIPAEQNDAESMLRTHLKTKLPDYMVPAHFVWLDELPLSANGKVDRRALPAPQAARTEEQGSVTPANKVERGLRRIWQEILELDSLGVTDDFFELGGHSLLAVRMFAKMEEHFGKRLPLDVLFEAPTIRQLAEALEREETSSASSSIVVIQPQGDKAPLFLVPPSASPGLVFARLARALGRDQPLYGLTPPPLSNEETPQNWFESTASHYLREIRTIQPRGPYYLGGRCFGGFLAYEMAQQLRRQKEDVALLMLMDVGPPLTRGPLFYLHRLSIDTRMRRANEYREREQGLPPVDYVVIPYHPVHFDVVPRRRRHKASQDKLIWDANLRAASEYVTRPYAGRITLLQSEDHDSDFVKQAWLKLARGGMDYVRIEGGHKESLREPLVRNAAEKVAAQLAKAHSEFSAIGPLATN